MLDLQGREARAVADGEFGAGWHRLELANARQRGALAPGLYFVRLEVAGRTLVRRFVLTR